MGHKFMECSALDQKGLNEAFTEGISKVLKKREAKRLEKNAFCTLI